MITIDFNKFFHSKAFKGILCGIAGLIILLLVFGLGVVVGIKKANFSYRWGENYHRNFGGPRNSFIQNFPGRDLIEPNGVYGQIIKIELPNLIINGSNNTEKIVVLKNDTVVRRLSETISPNDLKTDDYVTIIGSPNDAGQIEAKLIRIMPSPPTGPDFLPPPIKR